jgi:hypothetical protein
MCNLGLLHVENFNKMIFTGRIADGASHMLKTSTR